MAYDDFLAAFAESQGIESTEKLLGEHSRKYSSIVNARTDALSRIDTWKALLPADLNGFHVLHVNCHHGSILIELAKRGATAVGIDTTDSRLDLARKNAANEADVAFLRSYFNVRSHVASLAARGPFNLIIINDHFERAYDTIRLLESIKSLSAPGALLAFRIPNSFTPRAVLSDPAHKKVGTTLLPPERVVEYTGSSSGVYYRRLAHYKAMLQFCGFAETQAPAAPDVDAAALTKQIEGDLNRIRQAVGYDGFAPPDLVAVVRSACREYIDEVRHDIANLPVQELAHRYGSSVWEDAWRVD